jgi:ferredoxin
MPFPFHCAPNPGTGVESADGLPDGDGKVSWTHVDRLAQAGRSSGGTRQDRHSSHVIHPQFGNFILLGTVLLSVTVSEYSSPLDYNPCLECKLCVAACPTGAIEPDGSFNFGACYTHNYREFMSGFGNFVETIADSRNAHDYRARVSLPETVSMWQSLSYGANYKAAYCMSVCPAGEDVIGPFLESRGRFLADVVKPLQDKVETIYVTPESDAAAHVEKRFPHKRTKTVDFRERSDNVRFSALRR